MTVYNFQNPYNNVGAIPNQPYSSVNGKVQVNQYLENAGLIPGYNFANFGQKLEEYKSMLEAHRAVQHVDPFQWENLNPTNILPQNMPLWGNERLNNYRYLDNPHKEGNVNWDYSSSRTYIPGGYKTAVEGYPTISPIYVGLANSKLSLGTASFN